MCAPEHRKSPSPPPFPLLQTVEAPEQQPSLDPEYMYTAVLIRELRSFGRQRAATGETTVVLPFSEDKQG